jgi:hypothetical protein
MKKLTLSKAKKKAWKAFSLYIRMKDATEDRTVNICYTCGEFKDIKKMNAGHGIGGRNNAILFEERIVRPQCIGCNLWGRGQYQIFTRQLIDELGLEVYDQIVTQSRVPVKYSVTQLLEIEEKYKKLVQGFDSVTK